MSVKEKNGGTDLFQKYLNKYKDQVKSESTEGYYHVDVVAEAYNQGFSDGEKSGRQDFIKQVIKNKIERFTQKGNQVYILSQNVISYLRENKFPVESLHINLYPSCPKVIISVANDLLLNDDFVEKAYTKVFENKNIFNQLFSDVLDIGFVSNDGLDTKMLKEDGFGYVEDYSTNE